MPKVSDYSAITTPADTDVYYVIQGGVSKKVTWATIKAAVIGQAEALIYKGVINCSANPNYPAADAGHIYIVSVAGKIGGASGTSVTAGDMLICDTDGTAAGTQAAVGSKWNIVQSNIDLSSIAIIGGTIDSATIGATTAGTLRSLFDPDVVLSGTLTANQCSGGVITNYGQTAADTTVLLPTAFEGGNFLVVLGTAQAANDYILDLATGTEVMYLDGVALGAGKSIYIAAPTIGAAIQFVAQQTGESSYQWFAYTVSGAWVGES